MKQLLESGVHFGHQTRRWNPKMKPYIFTERGGIHIIDLQQTTVLLDRAYDFVRNIAARGGTVLFVGTKKQCQDVISEEAARVGMPFVSHRWLGGLLTNFTTIDARIKRMHELRKLKDEGQLSLLPTKERMAMERELEKLEVNLGGVSTMTRLPDAVFVADPKREAIATKEVNKLGLPLIGLCDTNCDPDEVEYLIPGNDDAIRSCSLIVKTLARAVEEGRAKIQIAEFQAAEAARVADQTHTAPYSSGEGGGEYGGRPSRQPRGARGSAPAAGEDRSRGPRRAGADGRTGDGGRRGPRPEAGPRPVPAGRRVPTGQPALARAARAKEAAAAEGVAESAAAVEAEAVVGAADSAVHPVEAPVVTEVTEAVVGETPAVEAVTEAPAETTESEPEA
jgi:small subunit ribosomal protein S2